MELVYFCLENFIQKTRIVKLCIWINSKSRWSFFEFQSIVQSAYYILVHGLGFQTNSARGNETQTLLVLLLLLFELIIWDRSHSLLYIYTTLKSKKIVPNTYTNVRYSKPGTLYLDSLLLGTASPQIVRYSNSVNSL